MSGDGDGWGMEDDCVISCRMTSCAHRCRMPDVIIFLPFKMLADLKLPGHVQVLTT